MNWDRIDSNWERIKGNVLEQWDDLTEDQLASRIRETAGDSDDEPERELTDWQQRLKEIVRSVPTEAFLRAESAEEPC
jgi:uncharacterized protein YjbJ (UPF0337 family)